MHRINIGLSGLAFEFDFSIRHKAVYVRVASACAFGSGLSLQHSLSRQVVQVCTLPQRAEQKGFRQPWSSVTD